MPCLRGWPRQWVCRAALCWLLALLAGQELAQAASLQLLESGQRIYQQGLLGEGQALRVSGAGGTSLDESAAACVQCHRRSGLCECFCGCFDGWFGGFFCGARPVRLQGRGNHLPIAGPLPGIRTLTAYDLSKIIVHLLGLLNAPQPERLRFVESPS